jgi:biopolymer transport protein ExbB
MGGTKRKPKGLVDNAVHIGVGILRSTSKRRRKLMNEAFFPLREVTKHHRGLAKTIVVCAPLAGLLGTVAGMIEMFDSLASQQFFSQSGGIAGGIAEALFTTQLGLTVAVPGMIIGRVLEKREESIQRELDQVIEMVCALEKEEDREDEIQEES